VVEDLDSTMLTARYLAGRKDGLLLRGKAGRICVAASVDAGPVEPGSPEVRD
jgi:F420-0:gamma-glutamyl ligase